MRLSEGWAAHFSPLALNILLATFSCLAAIGLARLLFVWIETPFMALGKQISARLSRHPVWDAINAQKIEGRV